jgi:ketosteroid isomerase-like protein
MPSDHAALIHRFNDAFNRRDFDPILLEVTDDVELHEWQAAPGAQVFHGRDGARRAFDRWFESWEWMEIEIEAIEEDGDRALVTAFQRARGSVSGAEVSLRSWNVYEFHDGRVRRLRLFTDEQDAREAWQESGLEGAETIREEKA